MTPLTTGPPEAAATATPAPVRARTAIAPMTPARLEIRLGVMDQFPSARRSGPVRVRERRPARCCMAPNGIVQRGPEMGSYHGSLGALDAGTPPWGRSR